MVRVIGSHQCCNWFLRITTGSNQEMDKYDKYVIGKLNERNKYLLHWRQQTMT